MGPARSGSLGLRLVESPTRCLGGDWLLDGLIAVASLVVRVRRLNEQFQLVVDNIPAVVWSKGPDGSADFLNQYFQEYTGISTEGAHGWAG
jgi:PAS domain-containing protein